MSRARKIVVVALAAGAVGWCWRNKDWFLGMWAMRHAND